MNFAILVILLLILLAIGGGAWWYLSKTAPVNNQSNLTAAFTCAGSNAAALATFYEPYKVMAFKQEVSNLTNYNVQRYNDYYVYFPKDFPKNPQMSDQVTNAVLTCAFSTPPAGSIQPPCPSGYQSLQMNNNTVCVPPSAPSLSACPPGYTDYNFGYCLPPKPVNGTCTTGTLNQGWCIPSYVPPPVQSEPGWINPPCPQNYTEMHGANGLECMPPMDIGSGCPTGFTKGARTRSCLPPKAVNGTCTTGTLNQGWCIPK